MSSRLVGRKVLITDKYCFYWNEWGIITGYDGAYFYIKIADDDDCVPIFTRNQFEVLKRRKCWE